MSEVKKSDLIYLQNEILKDMAAMDKKFSDKITQLTNALQNNKLITDQKFEMSNENYSSLLEKIESNEDISNIKTQFSLFKEQINQSQLINTNKIFTIEKDLKEACYKYDNYFNKCLTRTNLDKVPSPVYFENGDLLFTCTGELVEEIGKNVLYKGKEKCLAGGDIVVMKHHQHPGFLNYAMGSQASQMQKSYGKAKLKVVHISSYGIGNVFICLPNYEEQVLISDYLDDFSNTINKIILIKQKKIEELGEYKKSLIYEYVTGKKEVMA